MSQFTIRDIEHLCGIKAHTLRAWEQRYPLFKARRKESLHRIYDDNDLKVLLRISFLYHHGYRISEIAAMSPEAIEKAIREAVIPDENYGLHIHQLVEASVDFDKDRMDRLLNTLLIRLGMDNTIRHVFYPFLQRIGLLWMTNHMIPAQEHFCSHILRKKILLATDGLEPPSPDSERFLVFAPEGENHEIPLLTAQYYLRLNGQRTVYMGRGTRLETILYYLEHQGADYLFTHLLTCLDENDWHRYFRELAARFRGKAILVSGPATGLLQLEGPVFRRLESIDDLVGLVRKNPVT